MITLDTIYKSLEAKLSVETIPLQIVCTYDQVDDSDVETITGEMLMEGGTPVTVIPQPYSDFQNTLKFLSIFNSDTAPATIVIQMNTSGTTRVIGKWTLGVGYSLHYTPETGFQMYNELGVLQTGTGGTTGGTGVVTSADAPLIIGVDGVISIAAADATTDGYLTKEDWVIFNSKQAALSGTGLVKSTAGTISYVADSSANWNTAYSERNQWDGGSTGLVAATARTSLGITGWASNLITTANPSAVRFIKINADNTITLEDAATFRTSIGAGAGGGSVTNVTGTTNRVTVATGTTTPVIDIASTYVGQSSITTLGTITTGTWNGTAIADAYISSAATWNAKQAALSGTGLVKSTTGTISYITDNSTNWDTAYTDRNKWDGGATGLVSATGRTSLGGTTIGQAIFTLTNPSALGYLRTNADNTVTHRTYSNVRTDLGLVIGTDVQAYNSNLTTWAGVTPAAGIATFLANPTSANLQAAITDDISVGVFTTTADGYVPMSVTSNTTDFLRRDGTWATPPSGGGGSVTDVSGTTNRISVVTGTTTPVIDIASTYVGQTSITTLGTITTGVWNGTSIADAYISSASAWNAKQAALSGTGLVKSTAGTISYITDNSANWDKYNQWDGGATGLVAATGMTSLGGTTVGQSVFTSTNPTAITFLRANADNTVSWLDAATFRTAIGAGTGSGTVTGVTGTTNRITSSGGATPAIDIAATYVGQTSITTLGTIATGTWQGTAIADTYISSSAAWNAKQAALSGTGLVKSTAGTITYVTDSSANWNTAYTERNQWDGGSTGLTAATGRTSLGGTTVGQNIFTVTDPTAIRFIKINADNTVTLEDAATFRTSIGAGTGSGTVTSVTGTTNRISSTGGAAPVIDIAATYVGQTSITTLGTITSGTWTGTVIGDTYISSAATWNAKQAALSGTGLVKSTAGTITYVTDSSANWDTAYTERNQWDGGATGLTAATGRTSLGGTTVGQNLFTLTNPSALGYLRINADNTITHRTYANVKTDLGLTIGTDVQAYNANLTTWAGVTPAAGIATFLATPTSANLAAALTDEISVGVFSTTADGYVPMSTTSNTTDFLRRDGTWATPAGDGSGVTTMTAIGAVPNANAASISGVNLTLQPASASFGGVVTTGTQSFAGEKTYSGRVIFTDGIELNNILTNIYMPYAYSIAANGTVAHQFGGSSQIQHRIVLGDGASDGTMGAADNYVGTLIMGGGVNTAATGTHAWLASSVIKAFTVTNNGAVITNTANLYIDAPSVAGTNNYSLYVNGAVAINGALTSGIAPTFSAGINFTDYNTNIFQSLPYGYFGSTVAEHQFAGSTNNGTRIVLGNGSVSALLGLNTNFSSILLNGGLVTENGAGTHAWITGVAINKPVITGGAAVVTNTAVLYVDSAATAGTNNYSLYVNGNTAINGTVTATTFVGALTGNASTATALQTARNINGTAFDGTGNITVTAAAGTLTGTTLNSTVVASSLTSVGTITAGVWNGTVINYAYLGTGGGGSTKFLREDNTWQTLSGGGNVSTTSANAYTAGMKQSFQSDATTAGLRFVGVSSDPSSLTDGDVWYNTTAFDLKYRANGVTQTMANLNGTQIFTNKTWNGAVIGYAYLGSGGGGSTKFLREDNTWQTVSGGGGITRSITSPNSTTTGGATALTDYVYMCTGTWTYTQPTAVGNTNRYTIKNTGTGVITIVFTSGQTVDGYTTINLYPNDSMDMLSNNTNWYAISEV